MKEDSEKSTKINKVIYVQKQIRYRKATIP